MDRLKSIALDLVIGFLLTLADVLLQASFLREFLLNNLITLLIALFAINITTISIIMSKLTDLHKKEGVDFSNTIRELKGSVVEQILYIGIAIVGLIISESTLLGALVPFWVFATSCLLATVLIAALQNLYDTGRAVFILYNYETKSKTE